MIVNCLLSLMIVFAFLIIIVDCGLIIFFAWVLIIFDDSVLLFLMIVDCCCWLLLKFWLSLMYMFECFGAYFDSIFWLFIVIDFFYTL